MFALLDCLPSRKCTIQPWLPMTSSGVRTHQLAAAAAMVTELYIEHFIGHKCMHDILKALCCVLATLGNLGSQSKSAVPDINENGGRKEHTQ